ncbi:MAG: sigma-70 family RNA polymerase sigma factor, partial [Candidatus Omnitrophica bacterium]|nr:sigma-70 family RNA polymerase sigma factor [Candidatus Omnitrophota bacterium]
KSVSIDDLLNGIDDDSYCEQLAIDDESFESIHKSDINLILLNALEKLSGRQQELCRLIREEGLNLNQVSKKLNIPRATLYDEVLRIREVFRKEGLKDYL